jgi:3-phosphoglycerate kinase
MILDVGPCTIEHVISALARTRTLVWNGPFGAFEHEPFDNGTIEVAQAAAEFTAAGKLISRTNISASSCLVRCSKNNEGRRAIEPWR